MKKESVDIERIQEFILSFAEGNFSKRAIISQDRDDTDTILAGINMLGEELETMTVSRDYFLSIYNAIADLLFVVDNDGTISDVNNAVCEKLKINRSDIINTKIGALFTTDRSFELIMNKFMNGRASDSFETNLKSDKTKLPVRCTVSKLRDENTGQEGFVITATDISFEKAVEKEILNTIITTEEKEKTRVAYDLHDSLGQELNAIKMYFNSAAKFRNDKERFDSIISTCKKLIDGSIDSVREIARDLMPKVLEDGELFSALDELTSSIAAIIAIEKQLPETEFNLSQENKVKIYRIVQEFLSNTLKHSGASQIALSAGKNRNNYYFSISDNGQGFDKNMSYLGNGVRNIETRLKALDAEYVYNSKPDHGTSLKFELRR